MEYFKIGAGKFIQLDGERATILYKDELTKRKGELVDMIKDIKKPSNEELLAWAKSNYPYMNTSATEAEIERLTNIINLIKTL